jgi:hypothetical protein
VAKADKDTKRKGKGKGKPAKSPGKSRAEAGQAPGKPSGKSSGSKSPVALRELLRIPPGKPVELASCDARATPAGPSGKAAGVEATARMGEPLADLQERLWASGTAGDRRRILLILQGMDTSGKGGTVKHWKFSMGDIEDRALWPAYQEAYEIALERCSTDAAPWYVVPADRKWYRNWAVSKLLLEHLEALDPKYPKADFDVAGAREQLLAQG